MGPKQKKKTELGDLGKDLYDWQWRALLHTQKEKSKIYNNILHKLQFSL